MSEKHVLDEVDAALSRFVAYPSPEHRTAHTLWIAHTHLMDCWDSTPRIAFLSPEPGSGKTRALEITSYLVPNPVEAVNVTPAYLFRKVGKKNEPLPTILYDEIDTVFGPKAKDNEEIRGLLNAGHRRGAVTGRVVIKGRQILTEEFPAYSAVAMAGLGNLPDTLMSRAVAVNMQRRKATESVTPFRPRVHGPELDRLRGRLAAWCKKIKKQVDGVWPELPAGIEDREADIWEPLVAIADAAGGEWPDKTRSHAVTLVTHSRDRGEGSLGIRLLADIRTIWNGSDSMFTKEILKHLNEMEEAPWGDLYGKELDSRGLAKRLGRYGVSSRTIRHGEERAKGYHQEDLWDAWERYLSEEEQSSLFSGTGDIRDTVTGSDTLPGVTNQPERDTAVTDDLDDWGDEMPSPF